MHAPATLDEAASLLREFASAQRTVGLTGADAASGPAAVAVDEVVSTRALDGIVEYIPSDQIVTVQAGMTIARLQAALRKERQRLALDPPDPEHATVGGVVASASYGPLRTRYGTTKDTIVGMTIVRADGTIARGGSKVVKNVAGFDIPKLMIGTYGTLAMIGTVTFRLHPLPQATTDVIFPGCDARDLRDLCAILTKAQLEPSAVYAAFNGEIYAVCVRFEGFPDGVAAQSRALVTLAKCATDEERALEAAHEAARIAGALQVRITAPSSLLDELHSHAIAPLFAALDDARTVVYPVVGAAFVGGEVADATQTLRVLQAARTWAESVGGTLVTSEAPPDIRSAFDAWGTPPPAFALMRALKERFDPQRRLNPGGFVGGL
jgi:glycolate oxidase FAD binding subunit